MNAVKMVGPYEIEATESGIRCGNHGKERTYHANPASVRECYRLAAKMIEDQEAYEREMEEIRDEAWDETQGNW